MAEEDQIAGGRQRAGKVRVIQLGRCLDVAGDGIDGLQGAMETLRPFGAAAGEAVAEF